MIRIEDDGVTHLNIYSQGNTELGRMMSNFYYSPFSHPLHGNFNSVEGYWYWLKTRKDELRILSGLTAKQVGREYTKDISSQPLIENAPLFFNLYESENNIGNSTPDELSDTLFQTYIELALLSKVNSNYRLKEMLKSSTLPFKHYYVMPERIIDRTENSQWVLDIWTDIRAGLQDGDLGFMLVEG